MGDGSAVERHADEIRGDLAIRTFARPESLAARQHEMLRDPPRVGIRRSLIAPRSRATDRNAFLHQSSRGQCDLWCHEIERSSLILRSPTPPVGE